MIRIGRIKKEKGDKIYIYKDMIHSDYIFKAKQVENMFPTKKNFVKIGWGDRKIFLETKEWKDLKLIDFLTAFFGLNQTVLRVEYLEEVPKGSKEIELNERQIEVLKIHVKESFYGEQIRKKSNYNQKGEFYKSKLRYNCVTNCNNWVNRGLYLSQITNKVWCPLSFLI